MRFRVGDKVTWCGVRGVVVKDFKYKDERAAPLFVEFEERATGATGVGHELKQSEWFTYDGKLHHWHKEPSLKPFDSEQ